MANKDVFDEKMEALADAINAKAGTSGALTLDGMKSAVDAIELGSNVIANPTLEGGEDDLTSIEIDGTKYAIPEGSSVEANPTLAGTEDDLVAIEVDGIKYKVPKGSYVATKTSNTQVSAESLEYIRTHYSDTPCYIPYTSGGLNATCLFRVVWGTGSFFMTDLTTTTTINGTSIMSIWLAVSEGTITYHSTTSSNVVANPSSTGSANLAKLSVNGTTYNIPQGTEVAANPTLAGTEADLTGIEVDGTKYKVGGGTKLYQHIVRTSGYSVYNIISERESPYDASSLAQFLFDNGVTSVDTALQNSFCYATETHLIHVESNYLCSSDGQALTQLRRGAYLQSSDSTWGSINTSSTANILRDTVISP